MISTVQSVEEITDRLTILLLKIVLSSKRDVKEGALNELIMLLKCTRLDPLPDTVDIIDLLETNSTLWDIENEIRQNPCTSLILQVHQKNARRFEIKRHIGECAGGSTERKDYEIKFG